MLVAKPDPLNVTSVAVGITDTLNEIKRSKPTLAANLPSTYPDLSHVGIDLRTITGAGVGTGVCIGIGYIIGDVVITGFGINDTGLGFYPVGYTVGVLIGTGYTNGYTIGYMTGCAIGVIIGVVTSKGCVIGVLTGDIIGI